MWQRRYFNKNIELTAAKIVEITENPDSDKLYIEKLDDGSGKLRTIQSGLRPYLKKEDLLGKTVLIASNLAPKMLRGYESYGMLLAGEYEKDGKVCVEVIELP